MQYGSITEHGHASLDHSQGGPSTNTKSQQGRLRRSLLVIGGGLLVLLFVVSQPTRQPAALVRTSTDAAEAQKFVCGPLFNGITSSANAFISPIESTIQSMDPIQLHDKQEYTFGEFSFPGGCRASATVAAEAGTLSGLDTTGMSVALLPGGRCNILRLSFKVTLRFTKTLTTLDVTSSGRVDSEACGVPIDANASGIAHVPLAKLAMDVELEGVGSLSPLGATLSAVKLKKFKIDVPSVDLTFLADSSLLADSLQFTHTLEGFIKDEIRTRVSEIVTSKANEVVKNLLPLTIP